LEYHYEYQCDKSLWGPVVKGIMDWQWLLTLPHRKSLITS
jgi:hypothetical protein